MASFFFLGILLVIISFLILYFSFSKLKGTARIIGMVIGYILLFCAGIGVYLGTVIT